MPWETDKSYWRPVCSLVFIAMVFVCGFAVQSNGQTAPLSATYGDANGDGSIDVGDAVFLINYIFKSGSAPNPSFIGDANGDEFPLPTMGFLGRRGGSSRH